MLNIYTDESFLTEDNFIYDNEAYFKRNSDRDKVVMSNVISAIEHGVYIDDRKFYDRFGVAIYCSCISTGAKTLINIASSDKIINGCELGENARDYMFWNIDGSVYLKPSNMDSLDESLDITRIRVNGKPVNSVEELEALL